MASPQHLLRFPLTDPHTVLNCSICLHTTPPSPTLQPRKQLNAFDKIQNIGAETALPKEARGRDASKGPPDSQSDWNELPASASVIQEIIQESEAVLQEPPPADASDTFLQYLHEVRKYPLLTPEQEYRLGLLARAGDRGAQELLVKHNLRFVITVARRYLNVKTRIEDLVQDGNVGLIKAAVKFDPERGVRFISYAVHWISQSIMQGLATQQNLMRLPAARITQLSKIRRASATYKKEHQSLPSAAELSSITGISAHNVELLLQAAQGVIRLDVHPPQADSDTGATLVERTGYESNTEILVEKYCRDEKIAKALSELRPRDAQVLRMIFGLDGRELTLEEAGRVLGVTRERVRQLRDRALKELRASKYSGALRDYATERYGDES